MLQIEHIYYFLFNRLFYDFWFFHLPNGVPSLGKLTWNDLVCYDRDRKAKNLLFFYDQEPVITYIVDRYQKFIIDDGYCPSNRFFVISERSDEVNIRFPKHLYYFYHGFASLDWFRGYRALNFNNSVIKKYEKDFISFNRIIVGDRSYRINFVSKLIEKELLEKGRVSFGVTDNDNNWQKELEDKNTKLSKQAIERAKKFLPNIDDRLIIDNDHQPGSASARIPITVERIDFNNDTPDYSAFWHIVTETVFYYDKLHLTEKIFKPIVSKQPFMLLAAPGNLEYLRSYGFKTFAGIIDESYDSIKDNDARIEAVVAQLKWYCDLSDNEKTEIQKQCEPIVEHNFHHFYGKFREIITDELLDNTKKLFDEIGYDDSEVDYDLVRKLLTS